MPVIKVWSPFTWTDAGPGTDGTVTSRWTDRFRSDDADPDADADRDQSPQAPN